MLADALRLLRSLPDRPRWSFGGGTALAVQYDHRVSYDIDIFVRDSDVLRDLTPARNATTRALLAGRGFEYPGNYLKLNLEGGEIDFIVAGRRTETPTRPWIFDGEEILIETPWEIAIKKIFYRPSSFKIRDLFDLAAVLERDPADLAASLPEVEDRLDKVIDRVERLVPDYAETAASDINPTVGGQRYMTRDAAERALSFLKSSRPAHS
ncbi:nucleotidyl transferase AbiEii/AbiGii toxin family protein [Azospirillum sp. YIM B02556]|uniref:Nucleotidyl transferase AbiEii/AbiGii toxin family protein n=1 Tax=Azospirillum endophyticum TaxID=2800326 RepID=A0ABS1EYZ9_9PROT|nr:nucleotidyl transferase AbiEii/AbiGii toxin family protein [Azospirillum endophyticum]MBK1836353.1 nucleotidyl transferase AbiEii/AbiGii toxin family protein [Azospirillum endophyticum]